MQWASRISAVAVEMVLPGLAGQWLDRRLGTGFLVFVGFALGLVGGIIHLLLMTRAFDSNRDDTERKEDAERKEDS